MVKGKHILILSASITTGYTVHAAIQAVNYYSGTVAGLSAIISTTHECLGIPDHLSSSTPPACPTTPASTATTAPCARRASTSTRW